ncbi:hypothetical protein KQX54_005569, partial [Cotesia glomerata]
TSILVIDNESRGGLYDVLLREKSVNLMYELYPNDLSNYESGAFNDIREYTEYSLVKTDQAQPDLTNVDKIGFLQDVKFGSKIKRPESAVIVQRFEDLINTDFLFPQYYI